MDPVLLEELGDMARLPLEIREEIYEHSLLDAGDKDEEVDLLAQCIPLLFVSTGINAEVTAVMARLGSPGCEHGRFFCDVLDDVRLQRTADSILWRLEHGHEPIVPGKHDLGHSKRCKGLKTVRVRTLSRVQQGLRLTTACCLKFFGGSFWYHYIEHSMHWRLSEGIEQWSSRHTPSSDTSHIATLLKVFEKFASQQEERVARRDRIEWRQLKKLLKVRTKEAVSDGAMAQFVRVFHQNSFHWRQLDKSLKVQTTRAAAEEAMAQFESGEGWVPAGECLEAWAGQDTLWGEVEPR
ncbi:hypothetical protein LTR27_008417 [Elasticomyces elasticus]|nr:hypothetical protein LTR27_008417 [Elasticomyces elasticus]